VYGIVSQSGGQIHVDSPRTVYSLCRRGELRHHRVSNAIRVSEHALAVYLTAAGKVPSGGSE
jgi:hypothetical protein